MFSRIPRRVLLFCSLVLMFLANLSAGLVLLSADSPPAPLPADTAHNHSHLSIVDADQLVGLELEPQLAEPQPVGLVDQAVSFVPVISCILITFGYACGLGPVPFILFGELFPGSLSRFKLKANEQYLVY